MGTENAINVVASSDWHIRDDQDEPRYIKEGQAIDLLREMDRVGDLIVYAGDFTDFETESGVEALMRSVKAAAHVFRESSKPKVAVLGNHDFEGGKEEIVKKILEEEGGIAMLQGYSYVLNHEKGILGVAGVKGLGGGFGRNMVPKFGEDVVRNYREAVDRENSELVDSLSNLKTGKILVVTHYSPIRETLASEGSELYHGLGNSGLEDAIDQFNDRVVLALHGHAHSGNPSGRTAKGVRVENVSIQVIQKTKQGDSKKFIPSNAFNKYSI